MPTNAESGGANKSENSSDTSGEQSKGMADLILKLVKEIIQKNHGTMTIQVDKKKMRRLITLKFPIERRKVIYYEPINL